MRDLKIKEGNVFTNKSGYTFTVVKYKNSKDIEIEWECGQRDTAPYTSIRSGSVRYYNEPTVFNIGYIGYGKYVIGNRLLKEGQQHVNQAVYQTWRQILERCYHLPENHKHYNSYKGCTVCEDWKSYQNFAEWMEDKQHYITNVDKKWCLDKDILFEGNKIYSPKTCVFVPNCINVFFSSWEKNSLGFGVNYIKPKFKNAKDGYISRCSNPITEEREYLGYYSTPKEAELAYINRKTEVAKLLADKWNGLVDPRVIDALRKFDPVSRFK